MGNGNRMMRIFLLAILLLGAKAYSQAQVERLILFYQDDKSPVDAYASKTLLPTLDSLSKALNIAFASSTKLPEDIRFTPAIVFQNSSGHHIYKGRFTQVDKIATFIRTARMIKPVKKSAILENAIVWQKGRATIQFIPKVTPLKGAVPEDFDADKFERKFVEYVTAGLKNFKHQSQFETEYVFRKYYANFYPYLDESGNMYISTELFSQYSCIESVFKEFDNPVKGIWQYDASQIAAAAGRVLEQAIVASMSDTILGDGFHPAGSEVPTLNWSEAGFPATESKNISKKAYKNVELAKNWTVNQKKLEEASPIAFSFPPPVDQYAGEVKNMKGDLQSGSAISGKFIVDMHSLTMGEDLLDHTVHEFLKVEKFPEAILSFKNEKPVTGESLAFGTVSQYRFEAEFDFMGKKQIVPVMAELLPAFDDNGEATIESEAQFSIRLKEVYGIEGPPGPSPQSDQVNFYIKFSMKPE